MIRTCVKQVTLPVNPALNVYLVVEDCLTETDLYPWHCGRVFISHVYTIEQWQLEIVPLAQSSILLPCSVCQLLHQGSSKDMKMECVIRLFIERLNKKKFVRFLGPTVFSFFCPSEIISRKNPIRTQNGPNIHCGLREIIGIE